MKLLNHLKDRGTNITGEDEICVSIRQYMGLDRASQDTKSTIREAIDETMKDRLKPIEEVIWTDILPRVQAMEYSEKDGTP